MLSGCQSCTTPSPSRRLQAAPPSSPRPSHTSAGKLCMGINGLPREDTATPRGMAQAMVSLEGRNSQPYTPASCKSRDADACPRV